MMETAVIMWKDIPQVRITWNPSVWGDECFEKLAEECDFVVPPILYEGKATFMDFLNFLESRCVPRTRYDLADVLKRYGLREYDPLAMCRRSHGRSMSDFMWVKFNDENITWDQIRLR